MSSSTPPRTPPLFLPHSVEQLIAQICNSKEVSTPDDSARRSLASIDEQSAIKILKKIENSPNIRTFSGFIRFLVKEHKENNINNNVSPPTRVCTINRSPTTPPTPITPATTSFAFASPSKQNHSHFISSSSTFPLLSHTDTEQLTMLSSTRPTSFAYSTTSAARVLMWPDVSKTSDASSSTASPFPTTTTTARLMMSPGSLNTNDVPRLPKSYQRGSGESFPHLVALGELEFRKQFLILNYLGGRSLEDYYTSPEEIRGLKDQPMILFESDVWKKIGRHNTNNGVEQINNSDWDTGKTHVYHCHVSLDRSYRFKGPFLKKERDIFHTALGDENILVVKFSKEAAAWRNPEISNYYDKYNWVSKEGILVGLRRYRFFVYKDGGKEERRKDPTSSGVKCFFVRMESDASIDKNQDYVLEGKTTVHEARCVFMHLHTLPSMAKYMARLSLILSKSMKLKIDLASVNVQEIEEIYCLDADGNYVYDQDGERRIHTDGTGFISQDLAEKCPKNIYKGNCDGDVEGSKSSFEEPPLLIQFRLFYNGSAVKGTCLLNKELPPQTIRVRPKMVKVETDENLSGTHAQNSLEVVGTSNRPKKTMNLSRNLIALLSYGGVPKEFFLNLVAEALKDAQSILTNRNTALRVAINYGQLDDLLAAQMVARGIPLDEPCLQYLLSIFKKNEKKNLSLGRIPIPECFYVMGTVDPTGKLNHDEVCIILDNGQISGKVLVYRHPGLHFGDIHLLKARYVPELENFVGNAKYAIFFPTRGPRSLADEMSGGDFDGDLYFVSRNPVLLQTFRESERWVQNSVKVKVPKKRPIEFSSDELEDELFKEFLNSRFNPSYAVGEASDSWLAFIDRLLSLKESSREEKACVKDNICRLVDIHSDALDAPKKSGIKIEVPDDLKAKMFPHYMEKERRNSFNSTSVLGTIYDMVKSHEAQKTSNIEIWKLPQFMELPEDPDQAYIKKWFKLYDKYRQEMRDALRTEHDGDEKNAATDNIFNSYKQELYGGATELEESKKSMKELNGEALAIYHIVYNKADNCDDVAKCKFVWKVAGPVLLNLYASKQGEKPILFTPSVIKELWGC